MSTKKNTTSSCTKCWVNISEYTLCSKCYLRYSRNNKRNKTVDYQDYVNIDSPPEVREMYWIGDIWLNQWQCMRCLDVIRSKNKHDMRTCRCWASTIDWWSWYTKCSWPISLQVQYFSLPSKNAKENWVYTTGDKASKLNLWEDSSIE